MTTKRKQARIKCPHCGKMITVRQKESSFTDDLSKEVDALWKAIDTAFKKIFK
jgi:DNA-directed RNA polymerase subunit RPC12/RpoP